MEYIKLQIIPTSNFATPPMSDTFFGQLCWQLKFNGEDLDTILADYSTNPFCVVSDMLPRNEGRYAFIEQKKVGPEVDKKKRIDFQRDLKKLKRMNSINLDTFESIKENNGIPYHQVVRNSIDPLTGTTGENQYAPYSVIEYIYPTDFFYTLYLYVKDKYKDRVINAIEMMGEYGFGADSSVGKGRYTVTYTPFEFENSAHIYTLGNCVIEGLSFKDIRYEPFTRFGKHGGALATEPNPFKKPITMARQGAVIILDTPPSVPYIGKAVAGISENIKTVHQGYSLYLPYREVKRCTCLS